MKRYKHINANIYVYIETDRQISYCLCFSDETNTQGK